MKLSNLNKGYCCLNYNIKICLHADDKLQYPIMRSFICIKLSSCLIMIIYKLSIKLYQVFCLFLNVSKAKNLLLQMLIQCQRKCTQIQIQRFSIQNDINFFPVNPALGIMESKLWSRNINVDLKKNCMNNVFSLCESESGQLSITPCQFLYTFCS